MKWIKKKEIDIRICNLTKISSIFRFKLFKHSIEKIDHRIVQLLLLLFFFFYFQNLKLFPTRLNLFLFFFFRSFSSRKLVDYQRRQTRTFTCHKGRHRHTPRLTRIRRPLRRRERERERERERACNSWQIWTFSFRLQSFTPIALDQHFRRLNRCVWIGGWLVLKHVYFLSLPLSPPQNLFYLRLFIIYR